MQIAFSMAVDRWHFPMLNDKRRNNAFRRAIRNRISQGYDTVLDVGTGTGLLSLYARDAGAKKIYACECSTVMAKIAEKVFERNNAKDIKLLAKFSSDLNIPKDVPERVKLIVTETFDAGLFGEHVIPSMINAHTNLLDANGIVIPMRATLFIAAVECEYMRHRSSVAFGELKEFCSLKFDRASVLSDDEYYDTENFEKVKIKYLTDPIVVLTINFNELSGLKEFSKDGIKNTVGAKCMSAGTIDGLVTWFKLHLDEKITIDSSEENSCWQLAVFPAVTKSCRENDVLLMSAKMTKGKLNCSYVNKTELNDCSDQKFLYRLPKEVITFLNDFEYVKLLTEVSKSHRDREIKNVLDTSPFPIYGLMLLKENKNTEIMYYKTDNLIICQFIEQIAEYNGVKEKLCVISNYDQIKCLLDSILVHNFDIKGELKNCSQEDNREFFRCLLKPNGILLPEQVFLAGQLVFSEDLPKMVYVDDTNLEQISAGGENVNSPNTFGNVSRYGIAECINEFKIDQIFDLNSSLYLYEPSSNPEVMVEMKRTEGTENVNFGKIDATNKPLPNALICWYKVRLTLDHVYNTKRNRSFMNHTAIFLEDELKNVISENNEVRVKVQQTEGLIKIKVL